MDAGGNMQAAERNDGTSFMGVAWSLFCQHPGPMGARYIYAAIFLIGNVTAWVLRENPKAWFQGQRRSGCNGDRDCLASDSVLLISFSNFLFFSLLFLSTVYTKTVHDRRSSWHSGWWPVKIILLLGCYMSPILVPDYFIELYGKVAPFGAGVFLFNQLVSVIRYITRLNSKWCGQANFQTHRRKVNTISMLAYGCSMAGIILMMLWYVGCYVNAALVFSTLLLVYAMPIIAAFSKAKGFYLEPLLLGVYIVFLCWSAIKSQPATKCYKKENTGSGVNWITIVSFIAGLASATVATFSTGTDYKCVQLLNVLVSENDVPYGYGFFHFVFATGSMYFGMLFLGWDTHHALGKWSLDVSWTSTIVHIVNEGLAVICFVVVVLARVFGVGWLEQLLGQIFGNGGQQQPAEDENRGTELAARSGMDDDNNNEPPRPQPREDDVESRTADEHEGRTTGETTDDNGPPQEVPRAIEPVGTGTTDDDAQRPSSSSSTTIEPSESQSSSVVRRRTSGEIKEEW